MHHTTELAIQLGKLALAFGRVNRATFHEDGKRPESDSDHVVMLGLIACSLAATNDFAGVTPDEVAVFVLVHDLVEAKVGDTNSFDLSPEGRKAKKEREDAAFLDLCEEFGSTSWVMSALHQYEEQKHPAARFVRYLDKAMPKITHYLNRCTAIREMGKTREDMVRAHQVQLKALALEYPEFKDTQLEFLLADLMRQAEMSWPTVKRCGKCGSDIPNPGPCPTCEDNPFGRR